MHGMAALEKGRSRAGWGSGLCQWLLGLSYSCLPGHEPGQLLGQEEASTPIQPAGGRAVAQVIESCLVKKIWVLHDCGQDIKEGV